MLTNYGEEYFLKVGLAETVAVPSYFEAGLSQSSETVLGETVTLGSINEVTGTGYSRQNINSDGTDWTFVLTGGDWMAISKEVTFTAAGTWTTATSMFLADSSGVILVQDFLSPIALTAGESRKCIFRLQLS